jgi:hypothetical protein
MDLITTGTKDFAAVPALALAHSGMGASLRNQ